jgi:hypothetical protein
MLKKGLLLLLVAVILLSGCTKVSLQKSATITSVNLDMVESINLVYDKVQPCFNLLDIAPSDISEIESVPYVEKNKATVLVSLIDKIVIMLALSEDDAGVWKIDQCTAVN